MKILIVSDTHKKNENYFKVLEMHHPDMVIHCGDAEGVSMPCLLLQNARYILCWGITIFFRIFPERSPWISDPIRYG